MTLAWLKGPKRAVLALPRAILEALPDEDAEVLGGSGDTRSYTLRLVVTERLEAQTLQDNERRAKLLNLL